MKTLFSCLIIIYIDYFDFATSNICYRSLCIPSGYDKLSKPPLSNITDTINNITIYIPFIQILSVNENENTLTLKLKLEIVWNEPRVTILPNVTNEEMENIVIAGYALPQDFKNYLWLPNVYIYNVQKIKKYKLNHDFENYWYWLDYNNKSVISFDTEVEIIIFCKMNFEDYPIDEQICYFLFGSPSVLATGGQWYHLEEIIFKASDQVALLDYKVEIDYLPEYMQFYKNDLWNITYQRTGFELRLKHNHERHLMNYYIPSGILVILSWVNTSLANNLNIIFFWENRHDNVIL